MCIAECITNAADTVCVIRMTRASVPVRGREWDYLFFVDKVAPYNSCLFSDDQSIVQETNVYVYQIYKFVTY